MAIVNFSNATIKMSLGSGTVMSAMQVLTSGRALYNENFEHIGTCTVTYSATDSHDGVVESLYTYSLASATKAGTKLYYGKSNATSSDGFLIENISYQVGDGMNFTIRVQVPGEKTT